MDNTLVVNTMVSAKHTHSHKQARLQENLFGFSSHCKLLTAEQFQAVFSQAQRVGNRSLTLLAKENNLNHPRLGLAISKKCAKRAVDRNRLKRLLRESFRLHQHMLPNIDIVAMCKPPILSLENHEIHSQIELQWRYLQKKFLGTNAVISTEKPHYQKHQP